MLPWQAGTQQAVVQPDQAEASHGEDVQLLCFAGLLLDGRPGGPSGGCAVNGERVGTAAQRADIPMLRTYRLWFEHTRKCDGCKVVTTAQDGCETGRELWDAYRLARVGVPASTGGDMR